MWKVSTDVTDILKSCKVLLLTKNEVDINQINNYSLETTNIRVSLAELQTAKRSLFCMKKQV